MRLSRRMRIAFTAPALSLALAAIPAFAHVGHDGPPPPPHSGMVHPAQARPMISPEARSSWLAECRARAGKHRKRYANDFCENYLDDYYAQYAAPQPYYGYQGGYHGAAYGHPTYAGGCCNAQPMMMVPIVRAQKPERECKEVVEYEYVDVPARPTPARRTIPDKRVNIAPDKRIPIK